MHTGIWRLKLKELHHYRRIKRSQYSNINMCFEGRGLDDVDYLVRPATGTCSRLEGILQRRNVQRNPRVLQKIFVAFARNRTVNK
jgi:hypothetical protein